MPPPPAFARIAERRCPPANQALTVAPGVIMDFVRVSAGYFLMGRLKLSGR